MNLRIKAVSVVAILAACSVSAVASAAVANGGESASPLVTPGLEGYHATGETQNCLRLQSIDEIDPIDEARWLITMRNGEVYLNEVSRGCARATSDFTYLQYTAPTGALCTNETVQVVDRASNTPVGSCGLGQHQALERIADSD